MRLNATTLAIAIQVLGRYVPQDSDATEACVLNAQRVVAEALDQGNLSAARFVVGAYESAHRFDHEGRADQLRPLIQHLGAAAQTDAELAARIMPLARDLGLGELREICAAAVSQALAGSAAKRRKAG